MKKCSCTLTQDGECDTCKALAAAAGAKLQSLINDFIQSWEALEEEFKRRLTDLKSRVASPEEAFGSVGSCRRCSAKYVDLAIAKMIMGLKGKKGIEFGGAIVKGVQKKLLSRGIKHWPLSDKALAEIFKKDPPSAK